MSTSTGAGPTPKARSSSGRAGNRVCLVTPGYISSTPRVVREADALSAAGYDVRVVFTQGQLDAVRAQDVTVLEGRPWRTTVFRWSSRRAGERLGFYLSGVRHRVAQAAPALVSNVSGMTERAEGRIYPELARAAAAEAADLYIGHYPIGLAAAARAAARHGAQLGYDVEDLYADTFPESLEWTRPRARILNLEHRYVPKCDHVSAVSQPVADAFEARYGKRPVVVHNCHPWADRDRMDGRILERRGPALSLFWFSQTVGLDRGLQDAIRAAGLMRGPVQIHLRGTVDGDVRGALEALAVECGIGGAVHFHEACPPAELLSRAAEHDVGLALEVEQSLNRRLTVTNKLFLYLTAGLALAATDLPGQRGIMTTCPPAGQLHRSGDIRTLADQLGHWAHDGQALRDAKHAALDAARTRWNAETEGQRLVSAVRRILQTEPRSKASSE